MKSRFSFFLSAIIFSAASITGQAFAAAPASAPASQPASQPADHKGFDPEKMADRMFAHLDTDKNGVISKDEAAKGRPFVHEHFDEIDTNKDGGISRAELVKWLQSHPMQRPPKKE